MYSVVLVLLSAANHVDCFSLRNYDNSFSLIASPLKIRTRSVTQTHTNINVTLFASKFGEGKNRRDETNDTDTGNTRSSDDTTTTDNAFAMGQESMAKTTIRTHGDTGSSFSQLVEWEVYVDQSKSSIEKGGSLTLDAFVRLAPASVKVQPAILPSTKGKVKGTSVRCIYKPSSNNVENVASFDVANVDSVDKVYRILTRHMKVKEVSSKLCDCLTWKHQGNEHLESGNIALAVDAYNNALATGCSEEEGIVLLMRATAYLQRAALHKQKLKEVVDDLIVMVPTTGTLKNVYEETSHNRALTNSAFRRVLGDARKQEKRFRRTQYWHGLYQYALLHAAQDSLRATQLLPKYATAWVRAGNILSELWKLKESAQYYEYAIALEKSLEDSLFPVRERLRKRQELLDSARAYGWSEDTLRLALDVTD